MNENSINKPQSSPYDSFSSPSRKLTAKELRGRDCLPKPINPKRLRKRLRVKAAKSVKNFPPSGHQLLKESAEVGSAVATLPDLSPQGNDYLESLIARAATPSSQMAGKDGTNPDAASAICAMEAGDTTFTAAVAVFAIRDKPTRAIVDSGACGSVVSYSWLQYLRMVDQIILKDKDFVDARKRKIPVEGQIILPLKVGMKTFELPFWVAKDMVAPLIIGTDLLQSATIDLGNRMLHWLEQSVPISITLEEILPLAVIANCNVMIPPRHHMWLEGKVIRNDTTPIQPRTVFIQNDTEHLAIASGFTNSNVVDGVETVSLHILNPSFRKKEVRRGTVLAAVSDVTCITALQFLQDCENQAPSNDSSSTIKPTTVVEVASNKSCPDRHKQPRKKVLRHSAKKLRASLMAGMKTVDEARARLPGKNGVSPAGPQNSTAIMNMALESDGGLLATETPSNWPFEGDSEAAIHGLSSSSSSACSSVDSSTVGNLDAVLSSMRSEKEEYGPKKKEKEKQVNSSQAETGQEEVTWEVIEQITKDADITEEQRKLLCLLLWEFRHQFSSGLRPAGAAFYSPHEIKLAVDTVIYTPQYRQSIKEAEIIDAETQKLASAKVVRPSNSPFNSPVLVVKKKDGGWRSCIDYRRINAITIKEPYPIPRAEQAFDALSGAKVMSTLDFTSGYWQIPLKEEHKKLTAYTTRSGRWEYNVLPMGITNAAPTFQRNMEIMLSGLLWKSCIVYIDDLIIFSNSFDQHLQDLREVFSRMKAMNLVAKPSKCSFAKKQVHYLGHVIGNGIITPDSHNMEKIRQARLPQTVKEIRAFNGLASYYRRFIEKFAHIAKPLTDLMAKDAELKKDPKDRKKILLPPEAVQAYETLKEKLTQVPVLSLPNFSKPFGLRTDASNYAIGAVLFQTAKDGKEHPICYASRVLSKTERSYSATEREMLAVHDWIRYFRPYLFGTSFNVFTDHSPLKGIKTNKDITGRLTRMILKLQEYDFQIHYVPGKDNGAPDALSRDPLAGFIAAICSGLEELDADDIEIHMSFCEFAAIISSLAANMNNNPISSSPNQQKRGKKKFKAFLSVLEKRKQPLTLPPEEIARMQIEDTTLDNMRAVAEKDTNNQNWIVINECLHRIRKRTRASNQVVQLVLPKPLREQVMQAHHDDLMAGHMGFYKTTQRISQWYYWPSMTTDIKQWIDSCQVCQQHKKSQEKKKGKLVPIEAERPFELMGLDILTDLPTTARGNKHIVVFTDYYTKWPEAFAVQAKDAQTVAKLLLNEILARHGAPERIITDRGSSFIADVYREITELLGVKASMTTAYHPQTDGQAERTIGVLHNILSRLTSSHQEDWDLHLPYALYAYRTSVHETTRETPFFLVYGRDPMNPSDLQIRQWVKGHKKTHAYTKEIVDRLMEAKKRVRAATLKQKQKNATAYNQGRVDSTFKFGDIVWLDVPKMKPTENRKLSPKWKGPYRIFQVVSKDNMIVDIQHLENHSDVQRVNANRLKKAIMRPGFILPEDIPMPPVLPFNLSTPSEPSSEEKEPTAEDNTKSAPTNKPEPVPPKERLKQELEKRKERPTTRSMTKGHTSEERRIKNPKGRNVFTQHARATGKRKRKDQKEVEKEVEKIVKEEKTKKGTRYLVRFRGYPSSHDAWISEDEKGCQDLIKDWQRRKKLRKK